MHMKKGLIFRSWYYFRTGWSTYFAFILGAVNTLTLTYYLAIEQAPALKQLFPTFTQYAVIGAIIVLPVLTLVGYLHYKKTEGFKAEADITIETNPHFKRMLQNSELTIPLCVEILELLTKISRNEKLTDEEMNRISTLKDELNNHSTKRTMKLD